jgi:Amidohydrolase family
VHGKDKRPGVKDSADPPRVTVRPAHVPLLAGTDAPNPGTTHGASLHRELELLVKAGLTPVEALAAATSVPAKQFGLGDRGTIAPGKRADLVLVDGDPTADIRATRKIAGVWKLGLAVDRDAYRAELEKQRAEANRSAGVPRGAKPGLVSDFEDGRPSARFGAGWQVSTDNLDELSPKVLPGSDAVIGREPEPARAQRPRGCFRRRARAHQPKRPG